MRDFCFIRKSDGLKATLRTDIVDDLTQIFTIMYLEGVQGTYFEKIMPFQPGTVTNRDEMNAWFELNKTAIDGIIYGGEQIVLMGAATFDLNITPKVVGAPYCTITLVGTGAGANAGKVFQDTVRVQNEVVKTLKMVGGWNYKITTSEATIGGDPVIGEADANKDVELTFNILR